MSTKEKAMHILDLLTEEQLQGFIMMFQNLADVSNEETKAAMEDIDNGRNLSRAFHSVKELMEDLDADD